MARHSQVGLAAFLLCSATVFSAAVASAAQGNASGPPQDVVGQAPTRAEWTIVATYSIPEGASGLAYDGTYLYCGIYGVNGNQVYRIDPATGAYSLLFTGPQEDAYGLTYDGQYLWTTDHPGTSSTPAVAMKMDWSGNLLAQIDLPAHYMSGIAYDNGAFWVARYYPDPSHLYKVNLDGKILADFPAPDNQPWDLGMENGNLWMADYWGDTLYQIDATTGGLLDSHTSEGVDPAGIVYDGQYLWYCDNGEGGVDYLYKVDLAGGGTPQINIPVASHAFGPVSIGDSATWYMTVQNTGTADLSISALTFNPADDLTATDTFPVVIPPSGNDQLAVVYAPDDFAPLDAVGTVFSNDPIHPEEQVTLTGHGVYPDPTIHFSEDVHNYGTVRAGARTRWFLTISNHGNTTLTITDIASDDAHFYLDASVSFPINLATLASTDVGVWFHPESAIPYSATLTVNSNDPSKNLTYVSLVGSGVETQYPMGQGLWSYVIDVGYDNSPKAMASIPDVSGDGIADVIVCSEDNFVRCFNGNAHGTGDVLWEHEIYGGAVYSQAGLQINQDVDGDYHHDVVVASAWGGRLIRTISGKTGQTIWTHDTHEYGDGGWVYAVDCSYDYNGDGVHDVLAATGDDAADMGPKRVYCLNGLTGVSIWERPLGGPGFAVIGVEDFTGDKQPDVLAGASNEDETQGRVYGIDGADGSIEWTFVPSGTSVWALIQIDDITGDGLRDVLAGDFSLGGGAIYGLDATDGTQEYSRGGYGGIRGFVDLKDVDGDGHTDIALAHHGTLAQVIDGQTGDPVWGRSLVDQAAVVAAADDLTDDAIKDVLYGTLFSTNHGYFLDGTDGTVLESVVYGAPVDAIAAIPDIVGDGSWEMVVGGRYGLVTCYSGGVGADCNDNGVPDWQDIADCAGAPACSDCNGNALPDGCDAIGGGDFDVDGNVDGADYSAFADCLAGPDQTPSPSAAECVDACLAAFDTDSDGDVDLAEFVEFQTVFTGPL
ncbi:MAG TPA: choice-of-anchor D domain-containing protein [Phycisphaerae bacterium]|nr:choice-of-anchor D domain-containing protein [Phycisphaerae bacterium]